MTMQAVSRDQILEHRNATTVYRDVVQVVPSVEARLLDL